MPSEITWTKFVGIFNNLSYLRYQRAFEEHLSGERQIKALWERLRLPGKAKIEGNLLIGVDLEARIKEEKARLYARLGELSPSQYESIVRNLKIISQKPRESTPEPPDPFLELSCRVLKSLDSELEELHSIPELPPSIVSVMKDFYQWEHLRRLVERQNQLKKEMDTLYKQRLQAKVGILEDGVDLMRDFL